MKINKLLFQQQAKNPTSKVFSSSLHIDLKNLFDKAIANDQPSPKNNYSSTLACRDLKKFFNHFMPGLKKII